MGQRRSAAAVEDVNMKIGLQLLLLFAFIWTTRISHGLTDHTDVDAINSLYVAMGSPVLPGWVASGGDPCGEVWQGITCDNSQITSIVLIGANLRGELGDKLSMFASIKVINLSNNYIGGSIPSNLPVSLQHLFLSANMFTGSIPSSLSTLIQLTDMSLNNNLLSGELPDAFDTLVGLINLDLSNNTLTGHLPPSMEKLSSLISLYLHDNQLSGTLDVLQDLPLRNLNIENNLFNGPIPEKMISITNFRMDGNPFNSSSASLPSPTFPSIPSPPFFVPVAPSTKTSNSKQADGPNASVASNSEGKKKVSIKRIVWISIAVLSLIILALACIFCVPTCMRKRHKDGRISQRQDIEVYNVKRVEAIDNGSVFGPPCQIAKAPRDTSVKVAKDHQPEARFKEVVRRPSVLVGNIRKVSTVPWMEDSEVDMSGIDVYMMPPPPPPPPASPPVQQLSPLSLGMVNPVSTRERKSLKPSLGPWVPLVSAKFFTVASLQQFTNSFSQGNLLGSGLLGSVYKAELPDGKLLAVKKLDKKASSQQKDVEFLELVNKLDSIRHANVVELMGYCTEHGQRLLIYEYCSNGTLQDVLHSDDELRRKFSWNTRIRMALGAARALEYLHEVCQPPIIHRNFKSANVLLDDDFGVRVSDCGLAALISSGYVSELSGHLLSAYGFGAPEFDSDTYTIKSDVFSFGVIMLELLTGRKSYDSARRRGEQFLVRWAVPQLHDIDALSEMVDPSIRGEYTAKSLSQFADIISRCVQSEPEFRPPMSEVVQDLLYMIRKERLFLEENFHERPFDSQDIALNEGPIIFASKC
ncbi:hypothetical protein SAY87_030432 [Trapa incisa]|uniref:Protein kinase domain-containing protein n=1 Tax=Trapa incisa TaxID=236973 RepID=A0AAN7KU71_9MYRT|nr:hypothetical protein SAY87_030432 [Trapa incisa]